MAYTNQDAPNLILSLLKTNVQKKVPFQLVFLKGMLLKRVKDITSDLINPVMENPHSATSTLLSDSDFVFAVKMNLFSVGSKRST